MIPANPILLRVYQNLLDSIAEQMGSTLERTGFSPNIKERRDYSCAIFDAGGEMVAHAAHIPVHLGSTPLSVAAAIEDFDLAPGDVVLLNDPYRGGTHLPDLTVVAPVFEPAQPTPTYYVANRAHHADVGGAVRGSMALFDEIYQEGLRIPPIRLIESGRPCPDAWTLILANMRQPDERRGDLDAQLGALEVGKARLGELLRSPRRDELLAYGDHLKDAAERHVCRLLDTIPDGRYSAMDVLDDDGTSSIDIPIRVAIEVTGDRCRFDFAGTAPQVAGCLNANLAIVRSAVFYVLRALAGTDIPANEGCMRPVTIDVEPGCLLSPIPPAAVAGGNVETSQRIVDVLLQAFAEAIPEAIPGMSQGTMNNLTLGAPPDAVRRSGFSYYETIGGGCGAHANGPGASASHSHMTNTRNTPVEMLEHAIPVRVETLAVRRGSGGRGRHRGGDGIVREIRALQDLSAALLSERRRHGAPGIAGGSAGAPGCNQKLGDRCATEIGGKWVGRLKAGECLRIETPGGGGWGEEEQS